jgi:hypothetical protein
VTPVVRTIVGDAAWMVWLYVLYIALYLAWHRAKQHLASRARKGASTRKEQHVTDRRVTPKYWALFAENAAPQAISAYLAWAVAERRTLDRYIAKLEALLERRTAEQTAGIWPTTDKEQP